MKTSGDSDGLDPAKFSQRFVTRNSGFHEHTRRARANNNVTELVVPFKAHPNVFSAHPGVAIPTLYA